MYEIVRFLHVMTEPCVHQNLRINVIFEQILDLLDLSPRDDGAVFFDCGGIIREHVYEGVQKRTHDTWPHG